MKKKYEKETLLKTYLTYWHGAAVTVRIYQRWKALKNIVSATSNIMILFLFAVKQGKPKDDELEELGEEIAENWKKLGRRLDINDTKLDEIQEAYGQQSERAYRMLKHWKQKEGSAATYQALCNALEHKLVQRRDLAEQFCYIYGNYCLRERGLPCGRLMDAHRLA